MNSFLLDMKLHNQEMEPHLVCNHFFTTCFARKNGALIFTSKALKKLVNRISISLSSNDKLIITYMHFTHTRYQDLCPRGAHVLEKHIGRLGPILT